MTNKLSFFNNTPKLYLESTVSSVVDGYIENPSKNSNPIFPATTLTQNGLTYTFKGFYLLTHDEIPPEYLYEYDNIFYYSKFEQKGVSELSNLLGIGKIYGDQYSPNFMDFNAYQEDLRDILHCFEECLGFIQEFIFTTLFSVKKNTTNTFNCLKHFSKNLSYCNNNHSTDLLLFPAFIHEETGSILDLASLHDIIRDMSEFIKSFKTKKYDLSDERIYSNTLNHRDLKHRLGEILFSKENNTFFRLDNLEYGKKGTLLINKKVKFDKNSNSNYVGCQEETSHAPTDCIKLGLFTDFTERSILLLNMIKYFQLNNTFKLYEEGVLKYKFVDRLMLPNIVRHITYYKDRMHVQVDNYLDIRKILGAHYTADTNHLSEQHDELFWKFVSKHTHDIYFDYTQQYLSLIGHKVVQFVISTNSFFALPYCDQHILTQLKSCLMNKNNLSSLYFKLKLNNIIQYGSNCLISETLNKQNIYSQCVLVLIGAIFLDSVNLDPVYNLLSSLLFQDKEIKDKWDSLENYYRNRSVIHLGKQVVSSYSRLEKELGIIFDSKDLLLVAIIHGLATDPTLFEDHYESFERLEFLGDAVLEFVVNMELILNQGVIDGDQVALKKTALTNNKHLCSVIEKLNIKKYYMAAKSVHVNFKSKRYADIFEALIGAIYVDKNLDVCYEFLRNTILTLDHEVLQSKVEGIKKESQNDKNLLGELVIYYENLSKQKGTLEYRSTQIKDLDEIYYQTEIYYNDVKCGEANGPTKSAAEKNAANGSYDFVFQNRTSLWDDVE
eukprot:GAHX01001963.1.p1 GENE.GAHX01001963.1~~GAHX01001963.1.p1  ORF type:complete len:779 (+),score=145.11 GAHX01001963.1:207-2543(+)